jgi:hypothetical protein
MKHTARESFKSFYPYFTLKNLGKGDISALWEVTLSDALAYPTDNYHSLGGLHFAETFRGLFAREELMDRTGIKELGKKGIPNSLEGGFKWNPEKQVFEITAIASIDRLHFTEIVLLEVGPNIPFLMKIQARDEGIFGVADVAFKHKYGYAGFIGSEFSMKVLAGGFYRVNSLPYLSEPAPWPLELQKTEV